MDSITKKAAQVRLVIFDVDGVLTDGSLYLAETKELIKAFHVHDGLGIKLLQDSGIPVAIISSRESAIVQQRLEALGVRYIYQGQNEKLPAFEALLTELNIPYDAVAYVGDDLPDIPLIQRAGFGVAVANASNHVKQYAVWHTSLNGGAGAAREVCEFILNAQGKLNSAIENIVRYDYA